MSILKIDKIDYSQVSLADPIKHNNLYLSNIKYNSDEFIIQMPKLTVLSVNQDSIELKSTEDLGKFLKKYDSTITDIISQNSEKWFSKELTKSKVSQIYKSAIVNQGDSVIFKMDDNIDIYTHNSNKMSLNDIKPNTSVILLMHLSYIIFYKANCIPYFNTIQMKIKEKKELLEFREVQEQDEHPHIKINLDEFEFN
jgi:hypothetical protein